MLFAPQWVMKEATSLFYSFLWNGKPDKIKRSTIIRQIKEGGLKMIDVESMARALKINWIQKMYNEQERKWTIIPRLYFRQLKFDDNIMCKSNYNESCLPANLPEFYNQCMLSYVEFKRVNHDEVNELL